MASLPRDRTQLRLQPESQPCLCKALIMNMQMVLALFPLLLVYRLRIRGAPTVPGFAFPALGRNVCSLVALLPTITLHWHPHE
jgi:hypothetical protein